MFDIIRAAPVIVLAVQEAYDRVLLTPHVAGSPVPSSTC